MPHAVGVDQVGTGSSGNIDASTVHVLRHTGDHVVRARPPAVLRPHLADLVQVAADSAGGDHHCGPAHLERLHLVAIRRDAAVRRICSQLHPFHSNGTAVFYDDLIDAVTEFELHLARLLGALNGFAENPHDFRACTPREVETRNCVAVAGRVTGAALCPADGGQHAQAQLFQVAVHLIGREAHVLAAPLARPAVIILVVIIR